MTKLKNQKIQQKLLTIVLTTIIIALLPLVVAIFAYEYKSSKSAAINELQVQAQIIADNVNAAVAFADAESAHETLASLSSSVDVESAALYLSSGEKLATYKKNSDGITLTTIDFDVQDQAGDEIEHITAMKFVLVKTITLQGQPLGILVLEASLKRLFQKMGLFFLAILGAALLAFCVAFAIGLKLNKSITLPLLALAESVGKISREHDFSAKPKVNSNDEIGDLSRAFGELLSDLEEREDRLNKLAFFDSLTKLPNRSNFHEKLSKGIERSISNNSVLALMFVDLDDFKKVNDTLGHDSGDELLKIIAKRLKSSIRKGDMVFRLGGDEFAIIIESFNGIEVPSKIAKKVVSVVSEPVPLRLSETDVKVGASIGISLCPDHATTDTDLLKKADLAMYVAKERSKNTFHIYDGTEPANV